MIGQGMLPRLSQISWYSNLFLSRWTLLQNSQKRKQLSHGVVEHFCNILHGGPSFRKLCSTFRLCGSTAIFQTRQFSIVSSIIFCTRNFSATRSILELSPEIWIDFVPYKKANKQLQAALKLSRNEVKVAEWRLGATRYKFTKSCLFS